ncbi:MAG TPA: alkaline phosphatase family protein [Anaerolineales bacterium]|nr:alkaline phosphatase family protein [Anaerolineales bacterium]HRQ92117.1 alkaline phosphatase family protein [Anaerolineales bacterium]
MKFLFLFMDGIGFGENDPATNPFAAAKTPNIDALLGGARLVAGSTPLETERASLLALDANLGMPGLPQSATGQAALLTGKNVPKIVGEHYGPKPNKPVAAVINEDNLFKQLSQRGYRSTLLNAYPPMYFKGIESGKRLLSAIPLAVTSAGIALKTHEDMQHGDGFSADFTGEGWRSQLGFTDAPLHTPPQAGRRLAEVTRSYDLAFFEFWPSDYAGHKQDHEGAVSLLEHFDRVMGGLLEAWNDDEGLVLITSDHGNMEDLTRRTHTNNPVPALVIGAPALRQQFCAGLHDLSQVTPAILQFYPPKDALTN